MTKNPIISFPYPHEVCLIILLTVFGSKKFGQKRSFMWQKDIVSLLRAVAEELLRGFASAKSSFLRGYGLSRQNILPGLLT